MLLGNFLFLLPFPVLLFILFRSHTPLTIPLGLRRLALAMAFLLGALLVAPATYRWILSWRRQWINFRLASGATEAEKFAHWLPTSDVVSLVQMTIAVLSQVALLLLLISIYVQQDQTDNGRGSSRLLREAAALATMVIGLAVIISIGRQIYADVTFRKQSDLFGAVTLAQYVLRNVLGMIPLFCELAVAFIVYKSQPSPSLSTDAGPEVVPAA